MHGDKSQGQRERALANFEAGVVETLIATDVAARGIDVAGITHVINYDIPATREDYVHRIGRTARAGASGVGVTLLTHDQAGEFAGMVGKLGLHRELELAGVSRGPGSHEGAPARAAKPGGGQGRGRPRRAKPGPGTGKRSAGSQQDRGRRRGRSASRIG
jgi:superfamily II DNA/RNA helicase